MGYCIRTIDYSLLYLKKISDDSLKEFLRESYWKMSEINFSALFEQAERLEPKTISGMPHDDRVFSPKRELSDATFVTTTETITTRKIMKDMNSSSSTYEYSGTIGNLGKSLERPKGFPPPPPSDSDGSSSPPITTLPVTIPTIQAPPGR